MTRRALFGALLGIPLVVSAAKVNQNWYEDLDKFAKQYNDFISKLKNNIFDTKSWLKTCERFHKLEQ